MNDEQHALIAEEWWDSLDDIEKRYIYAAWHNADIKQLLRDE